MKCHRCHRDAATFNRARGLCFRHYRADCMKTTAKGAGKSVPSSKELEDLMDKAEAAGMICVGCDREMVWMRANGSDTLVASLQHDRSGTFRIICLLCNLRHDDMPGDTFYDLPKGHWRCHDCKKVLPASEFNKKRGKGCKACLKVENAKLWAIHGKKWSASSAQRRAS